MRTDLYNYNLLHFRSTPENNVESLINTLNEKKYITFLQFSQHLQVPLELKELTSILARLNTEIENCNIKEREILLLSAYKLLICSSILPGNLPNSENPIFNNLFAYAVKFNDVNLGKLLITTFSINPSADNNRALKTACKEGNYEFVELLLTFPEVDPSDEENYSIRIAASGGHLDLNKLLMPLRIGNLKTEYQKIVNLLIRDPRVSKNFDLTELEE